jgi:hypothetical protein
MSNSITSISIAQICNSLTAIRRYLPTESTRLIELAIGAIPEEALSFVFAALTQDTAVIVRADAVYRVPINDPAGSREGAPPRWLVYPTALSPTRTPAQDTLPPPAVEEETLTEALSAFHFFEPLRAIVTEISYFAPDAARRIAMLQALRQEFSRDLRGDEFSMRCAVVMAATFDGVLHLDLVLDHDQVDPEAIALQTSCRDHDGVHRFVVLGPDGHPNSPTHGHLKLLHLN